MMGEDVVTELSMERSFESKYYKEGVSVTEIADKAVENSPVLEALRIDLDFYKNNYTLYQEYDGYDFGAEYEDLTYQIDKLSSELRANEATLRADAYYILGDIASKKRLIESYSLAYENASVKLEQGQKQLELGLAKQTDVHALKVSQASALMNLDNAKRNLVSAMIKLDMYIDYGVSYE
jgi:outer membrane protein TolC